LAKLVIDRLNWSSSPSYSAIATGSPERAWARARVPATDAGIEAGGDWPERWRDGQMVLRWMAAGMEEARRQFRRGNG
jgi:hypothetical protein